MKTIFPLIFFFSLPLLSLKAEVTDLALFRMGDDDGGAQAKEPVTETKESISDQLIASSNRLAPAVYSSDVPELTHLKRGESKFSIAFDGTKRQAFTSDHPIPTEEDHFGFECWAKWKGPEKKIPNDNSSPYYHTLFCNGNQSDGFEIAINTAQPFWNILYGGRWAGFNPKKPAQIPEKDVWTHIAMICDEGNTTLFINGVAVHQEKMKPASPTERFALGAINIGSYTFNGLIDEVRFFKFQSGKFDPETDLNFSK